MASLHLDLQRENLSLLKDYVIKMLAGLTTDYLHVSIAMTLCRALYYSSQGIYCTSAFLKLSNCLGNPLICFLLVTMWRESRLRASEGRLVNKPVEVLRDFKLTLSEYLVVVIICNSKVDLMLHFKPSMLLSIWLEALGKHWKK